MDASVNRIQGYRNIEIEEEVPVKLDIYMDRKMRFGVQFYVIFMACSFSMQAGGRKHSVYGNTFSVPLIQDP